ncbi:MAG: hypothetical protein AAF483_02670 [Planctomycetota bacterium]
MAASTAGVILSLVFLVVEKHMKTSPAPTTSKAMASLAGLPQQSAASLTSKPFEFPPARPLPKENSLQSGIQLTLDPALTEQTEESFPTVDEAAVERKTEEQTSHFTARHIHQPPEPVATVTLGEPVADSELTALPLHSDKKEVSYLIEAMDKAFERPTQVASSSKTVLENHATARETVAIVERPAPVMLQPKLPVPEYLRQSFDALRIKLGGSSNTAAEEFNHYVGKPPTYSSTPVADETSQQLTRWIAESQSILHRVIYEYGLEHPKSDIEIRNLRILAQQASQLAESMSDFELAASVIRLGYSVQRKADLWLALRDCLDKTSIALKASRSPKRTRDNLDQAIKAVQSKLGDSADGIAWANFLLLEDLKQWNASTNLNTDTAIVQSALDRLHWQELDATQRVMLSSREFQNLEAILVVSKLESIDFNELLRLIEQLEQDPVSRVSSALASMTLWLNTSNSPQYQQLAAILDQHYRNANLRLSVSGTLLERFLPESQQEIRPVRQRILGADTRGKSSLETELKLKLIPDSDAWHVGINVLGDMLSNTQASKGPAVFHSTSTAHIDSRRYLRISPRGYTISKNPTNVNSQDYLRKMSTDYDGLPVIGDFVRVLAREQFNQKRGLAKRVTQRIIAREADAELDRQLEQNLAKAESEFQKRLLGPLERMNLNPTVSSINTTESRLTVRYRVASDLQMASHTPRPRAPSDSFMSLQFHQSSLNNAIAQLGLSGRTWKIAELFEHLGNVFQQPSWTLPEDVPDDITIRFADTRAATIELLDGKLRLTLRIAALKQPSRRIDIERFLVHSTYVPIASGLDAELVRDGVVEIVSRRNRIPLRLIFAKVFVANPQIPLISQQWQQDEKAEGLAVSQLEIRDGWLGLALGNADSPQAAAVANRAQEIKTR